MDQVALPQDSPHRPFGASPLFGPRFPSNWLSDNNARHRQRGRPRPRPASGASGWSRGRFWNLPAAEGHSIMIEWHLWGDNPVPYRVLNLALHLTGAFMLWRLLAKFGLKWAWLGALFIFHHSPGDGRVGGVDRRAEEHALAADRAGRDVRLDRLSTSHGRPLADYWLGAGPLPRLRCSARRRS